MLLDTLVTGVAVVVLVASGIVALPWTSGEIGTSAHAYRTLGAVAMRLCSQVVQAPVTAMSTAMSRARYLLRPRALPVVAFLRAAR